jgi:hypothetical protein
MGLPFAKVTCRDPGCMKCNFGLTGDPFRYRGHRGFLDTRTKPQENWIVQYLRRSSSADSDGPRGGSADVSELQPIAPALVEFLTAATWEDGKARQVGTVMLFCEGPVWKLWLHDRDAKLSCFVFGPGAPGRPGSGGGRPGQWWRGLAVRPDPDPPHLTPLTSGHYNNLT